MMVPAGRTHFRKLDDLAIIQAFEVVKALELVLFRRRFYEFL